MHSAILALLLIRQDRETTQCALYSQHREARGWYQRDGRVQILAPMGVLGYTICNKYDDKVLTGKNTEILKDEYIRYHYLYAVVKCEWQSGIKYNGL